MADLKGKLKVRSIKVILVIFIVLMLLITGAGYMLIRSRESDKLTELDQYRRAKTMIKKKQELLLNNLNESRLNILEYFLTHNEISKYEALYAIKEVIPAYNAWSTSIRQELKTRKFAKVLTDIYLKIDTLNISMVSVLSENGNLPEVINYNLSDTTSIADPVLEIAGSEMVRLQNAGIDEQFDLLFRSIFSFESELDMVLEERMATVPSKSDLDILAGFIVAMLTMFLLFVYLFRRSIAFSIMQSGHVIQKISIGELPDKVEDIDDEFGLIRKSSNKLIDYLRDAIDFAIKIGEGNYHKEFESKSDHDLLGNALLEMRNRLAVVSREDRVRNWMNEGQTKFANILRQYSNDIQELGDRLISGLVEYTDAAQGGLFVISGEDSEPYLELLSAFAYGRKKYEKRKIQLGEGLAGQVFLERKEIYIKDIKEDHFYIQTGLGTSKPASALIVPLMDEDNIEGVLELAFLNELDEDQIAFIKEVAESIASSLKSGKVNYKTRQLLEDTRQKAEEMKAQEEELRQNMEELSATQEQMERLRADETKMRKEIEDHQKMMIDILNKIPEKIFVKDKDGKLILLNQAVADVYGKKIDELLGTTDFDFFSKAAAQEFRKAELKVIEKGEVYYNPEEKFTDKDGNIRILQSKKMPFFISYLNQTGLLGVQLDVTDVRNMEQELREKEKRMEEVEQKLQEEMTRKL